MNFPKTIKVGEVIYKVKIGVENDRGHLKVQEFAHINYPDRYISIDSGRSIHQKRQSLVHEIFHAIFRHTVLDTEFGAKEDEFVDRITAAFMMVAYDNPELVKLLLEQGETNEE